MTKNKVKSAETRKRILNFIVDYITAHGYAPTVREIGAGIGFKSSSTVQKHVEKMLEIGMLESDAPESTPRALRVPGYKFVKTRWIPVEEHLPETEAYVLMSFSNFSLPMIGRYEQQEDGSGNWYIGDCYEDDTRLANGLIVNAWMPLPEAYKEEQN